jgi:trehalose 6-phosphate synthase
MTYSAAATDRLAGPTGGRGSRLVVVSNRVPVPSNGSSPTAGGLAVALDSALSVRGGLWFGWSGKTSETAEADGVHLHEFGPVSYAVTDLSQRDLDDYYLGFANRALWPICHYRLDLTGFTRKNTAGYFRVNELFARRLAPLLRPDDVIWIHDYHFIPLALYLRRMGFTNRIGFFLHIPWPPFDLASALPAYESLIQGLCAYDVVGFQTPLDADNFTNCLVRGNVGRPVSGGLYEAYERRFRVEAFPIGIDTAGFKADAEQAESNALVRRMRASLEGKDLIIGVDRLDYSKGLIQRIEAFSCFIENNPGARNRVTYLQITPKSRSEVPEYVEMQEEVAQEIGSTNGTYGDLDWTPIRYINKTIHRSTLAGLYRMARVGLVTPLRDGMNLVAKEYVAAQRPEDPGVLILSRFAGAAHELDAALLVNPYDTESTSATIARALAMPLDERQERWSRMMRRVETNTVERWCARFLDRLGTDATAHALAGEELEPEMANGEVHPSSAVTPSVRRSGGWSTVKN